MFSFNSPLGACESCTGLGIRMEFDPDLIIPDRELCIADGAVALYRNAIDGWRGHIEKNPASLTGQYLSGQKTIEVPARRRKSRSFVRLMGCRENNR